MSDDLRGYSSHLAVGLAGEHLVCADLLALGFAPFRTEQAAAYDVAVDVGAGRILRLQVKAALIARPFRQKGARHVTGYTWGMRHGKGLGRAYAAGLVDGFALVALDLRRVAYVLPGRQILQIPITGARSTRRTFDDYPFHRLLEAPR